MRVLVAALAAVSVLGGCASGGEEDGSAESSRPVTTQSPSTTTSPPTTAGGVQPEGFALAPATITLGDGEVCELCLWVAEDEQQRARGLMGVTDLGAGDGMVFVYDAPVGGQFWMRDTPMPLSIAFFAADGRFVSSTDMEPCLSGPAPACPRYSAAGPDVAAIEVPQGRLAELGIAFGSTLALDAGTGCDDVGG